MRLAMVFGLCLAMPALAETPMTGAEFEARVTGRTLSFAVDGAAYGKEQYLPGRRVVWAFSEGPCREGVWYEQAPGQICFTYDHDPTPQCWAFFDTDKGLRAQFEKSDRALDLIEVGQSDQPLSCPGPDVGA
ncbi:MAG: hypothetical protein Q7J57_01070 [Gemmobacter sp.]|nr:hypothetical protein [Gemmobacter sp.]